MNAQEWEEEFEEISRRANSKKKKNKTLWEEDKPQDRRTKQKKHKHQLRLGEALAKQEEE